ncbi:MAG: hypothetical protein VX871_09245 [Pseudomonadota bacterium]|nr:hypothetical protein [Pseudomonadota bacterium]
MKHLLPALVPALALAAVLLAPTPVIPDPQAPIAEPEAVSAKCQDGYEWNEETNRCQRKRNTRGSH